MYVNQKKKIKLSAGEVLAGTNLQEIDFFAACSLAHILLTDSIMTEKFVATKARGGAAAGNLFIRTPARPYFFSTRLLPIFIRSKPAFSEECRNKRSFWLRFLLTTSQGFPTYNYKFINPISDTIYLESSYRTSEEAFWIWKMRANLNFKKKKAWVRGASWNLYREFENPTKRLTFFLDFLSPYFITSLMLKKSFSVYQTFLSFASGFSPTGLGSFTSFYPYNFVFKGSPKTGAFDILFETLQIGAEFFASFEPHLRPSEFNLSFQQQFLARAYKNTHWWNSLLLVYLYVNFRGLFLQLFWRKHYFYKNLSPTKILNFSNSAVVPSSDFLNTIDEEHDQGDLNSTFFTRTLSAAKLNYILRENLYLILKFFVWANYRRSPQFFFVKNHRKTLFLVWESLDEALLIHYKRYILKMKRARLLLIEHLVRTSNFFPHITYYFVYNNTVRPFFLSLYLIKNAFIVLTKYTDLLLTLSIMQNLDGKLKNLPIFVESFFTIERSRIFYLQFLIKNHIFVAIFLIFLRIPGVVPLLFLWTNFCSLLGIYFFFEFKKFWIHTLTGLAVIFAYCGLMLLHGLGNLMTMTSFFWFLFCVSLIMVFFPKSRVMFDNKRNTTFSIFNVVVIRSALTDALNKLVFLLFATLTVWLLRCLTGVVDVIISAWARYLNPKIFLNLLKIFNASKLRMTRTGTLNDHYCAKPISLVSLLLYNLLPKKYFICVYLKLLKLFKKSLTVSLSMSLWLAKFGVLFFWAQPGWWVQPKNCRRRYYRERWLWFFVGQLWLASQHKYLLNSIYFNTLLTKTILDAYRTVLMLRGFDYIEMLNLPENARKSTFFLNYCLNFFVLGRDLHLLFLLFFEKTVTSLPPLHNNKLLYWGFSRLVWALLVVIATLRFLFI